ncbi:MAG: thiamine-monophosphate kinase [Actinobacteria bacterium]|nr:thiamine-monophosphate kinase [Actinomycetota bacterium]
MTTVADLGEFGLIAAITARLPRGPAALVGPGDDAAVVAAPDRRVVATTDLLVEGRHFRRDWSGPADIGAKAAARNLADVAAMGAVPVALLVGLAAPGDVPAAWATELASGIAQECAGTGAIVAGGDVSSAGTIMIAVTALGDLAGRDPVTRSGARPGDVLAVTGVLGHSAAGQALLAAGLAPDQAPRADRTRQPDKAGQPDQAPRADQAGQPDTAGRAEPGRRADRRPRAGKRRQPDLAALVAAYRRPRPRYQAGPEAAVLGATSLIDVSDGLVADTGHLARASGVLIDLDTALLTGPGGPGGAPALRTAAAALASGPGGTDLLGWVLTGGEDHALAATFPPGTVLPPHWVVAGRVSEGEGVRVDGRLPAGNGGWDHFR